MCALRLSPSPYVLPLVSTSQFPIIHLPSDTHLPQSPTSHSSSILSTVTHPRHSPLPVTHSHLLPSHPLPFPLSASFLLTHPLPGYSPNPHHSLHPYHSLHPCNSPHPCHSLIPWSLSPARYPYHQPCPASPALYPSSSPTIYNLLPLPIICPFPITYLSPSPIPPHNLPFPITCPSPSPTPPHYLPLPIT